MRLLIIPDVHLSDRPPSIRRDGYVDQILSKLEFAVNTAASLNCEAIVQAGDLFHVKAPSRTSHELVCRTAEVLGDMAADLRMPVYVVPGNHDVQHDRLESLPGQPLGSLALHPNIHLLMGKHESLPVFGIPHLQYWSTQLRRWVDESKGSALTVTHAPLFPTGSHPPYEFISSQDWAVLGGAQHVYYGHIHDSHGVYEAGGVLFANHGALSRGSLHENTLKRKPAVTLYDDDSDTPFTRVEVPHLPADQVFALREKAVVEERQTDIDEFLTRVEETSLYGLSLEEVLRKAEADDLPPRALQVVREVLEEAAHG